jgi:hypothetical protein
MHPNGHTVAMAMNNQLILLCLGYNIMPLGSWNNAIHFVSKSNPYTFSWVLGDPNLIILWLFFFYN